MAALEVATFHARYRTADAASVAGLDRALREVAGAGLAEALVGRELSTAHAVCLREVTVPVRLDPGRRSTWVRTWSEALVRVVEERLATGGDLVVFPREVDVVVDVARAAADGDTSRAWAWHQLGVVSTGASRPTEDDVLASLLRVPALVPAVLGSAGGAVAAVLSVRAWVRVARAVRGVLAQGAPGAPAPVPTSGGTGRSDLPSNGLDRARDVVPAHVWAQASPQERLDLATLTLVCTAPARARDAQLVRAVADRTTPGAASPRPRRPRPGGQGPGAPTPWSDDRSPAARTAGVLSDAWAPTADHLEGPTGGGWDVAPATGHRGGDDARRPEDDGVGPSAVTDRAGRGDAPVVDTVAVGDDPVVDTTRAGAVVSGAGGVLFLVHAVTELGLAEVAAHALPSSDVWEVLARALAVATGVAVGDPATLALAGAPPEAPVDHLHLSPGADGQVVIAGLADALRGWARHRLQVDEEDDLTWVWHRRAVLDAAPGWTEVTFSLDDVDVRIRRGGLDLDPGFVWWLGGVMGFRYA